MRILIVFLILIGGAAALFYARNPQPRVERSTAALHATETPNAGQLTDDEDGTPMRSNDVNVFDPLPQDNLPSGKPTDTQQSSNRLRQAEPLDDGSRSVTRGSQQTEQRRLSAQWFALWSLERQKMRGASDRLATSRRELAATQKQRSDLAVKVSELSGDTSKLRAAMQAKADEIANLQHRIAEQADKDASSSGADHGKLRFQILSLQNKVDDAIARKKEADGKLSRSEALNGALQTKLTQLDATSREAASQARDKQTSADASAERDHASMAQASQKVQAAEAKVRNLTAERDAATARAVRMVAQLRLTASGWLATKVALASTAGRAVADRQAASDSARKLAAGNEALLKRSKAADAQIEEMKRASARATKAAAVMQGQMRDLKARSESGDAALADARGQNAKLKTHLDTVVSDTEKKLADLRQKNDILVGHVGRLPQLTHDLEAGRKQQGVLEGMVATLTAQNEEQAARMDAMKAAETSHTAQSSATADRFNASMVEASHKLRVAEGKARDLSAERDAATSRIAHATAQQRLTNAGLVATRLALANMAALKAAAEQSAGSSSDRTKQLAAEIETLRKRSVTADAQIEKLNDALSRGKTIAASVQTQGSDPGRASIVAALADARAETGRLAARLNTVTSDSTRQLTDLRKRNTTLASEATRLPQLEQNISEGRTKLGALEKAIAALQLENGGQRARIVEMTNARNGSAQQLLQTEIEHQASKVAAEGRVKTLDNELVSIRGKLAQANKDRETSNDARHSAEQVLVDVKAKLSAERRQVALLARRSSEAESRATRETKSATQQPEVRTGGDEPRDRQAPSANVGTSNGDAARAVLPDVIAKHVLLRYARNKARSQSRAQSLQATLKGLGMDVTAEAGSSKSGDSVTYYYIQDRAIADQVAQQINAPAPVRSSAGRNQIRRPGTIEIAVGG